MTEETIVALALEQPTPAGRAAFLAEVCGDDAALRRRVEARLRDHEQEDAPGERTAAEEAASRFDRLGATMSLNAEGQGVGGPLVRQPGLAESGLTEALGARRDATEDLTALAPREAPVRSPDDTGATIGLPRERGPKVPDHSIGEGATYVGEEDALTFLAPSPEAGSLGRLDHFEVLEVIGQGGMGVVLKARDTRLQRIDAIKVLAPQLAASATARKRFAREARAAAAVRDDHVVGIRGVYEDGPVPYLVMEFVGGITLDERLREGGPLGAQEVLRIGAQAARGLAAAHAQGLIHRDVKPGNILLEGGLGRVKITDFGLARAADDASITQSGVIAGTPLYMSPEQARGEAVDHRSDLFSLGSVLYTLCTGHPAFRAASTMAVLKRVCQDVPRPIRESNPEVPAWLCAVIGKLLAKAPADRIQTAAEVADLLGQFLAHLEQPDAVAPPPPVAGVGAWAPRRSRRRALLATTAVAAALAVALGGYLAWRPKDNAAPPDEGGGAGQAKAWAPRTAEELAALPSPLDGRTREQVSPSLLALAGGGEPALVPAEVVAILGSPWKQGTQGPFHLSGLPNKNKGGCMPRGFSPDGTLLVTIGEQAPVRVWDAASGDLRATLPAAGGDANSGPTFSPDGSLLAVFGTDRQIVLWDTRAFQKKHTLTGHSTRIWDACFSPDGALLASVGDDRMVRLWKVATGEAAGSFQAAQGTISRVRFSPSGKALATFDMGVDFGREGLPGAAAVKLWDMDPSSKTYRKVLREWPVPKAHRHPPFDCLLFTPDGKSLLYTANPVKNLIQAVDVATGSPVRSFELPGDQTGIFASALLSNGGKLLVGVGNNRKRITLTDVRTGKSQGEIDVPSGGQFTSAVVSPDGRTVAVGGLGTPRLRLFDLATLKERVFPNTWTGPVWAVAVSPDGRTIASGGENGTVGLWDLAGWKAGDAQPPARALTGHSATVCSVAYSPDGKYVASASLDGTIHLWDAATGKSVRSLQLPAAKDKATEVAFSADGKTLAAGGEDGSVRLWDVASGEVKSPLRWHSRRVGSVAFSPDGRFLASAGAHDRKAHLTDLSTLRRVQSLGPGGGEAEMRVAFGGDGRTLAYGGWDGTIRLWDLDDKKEVVLTGGAANLGGLAVGPTGRFVAVTGGGLVRFWDRNAPGLPLTIGYGLFGGRPRQVAFTPEGRYAVVAGANGTVSIIRTPPPHGTSPDRSVLDPRSPTAHTNLGNELRGKGKVDEAMASYKKALALDPKFARAHSNLGQALVSKDKVDEGLVSLRKSVELAPKYAVLHLFLADTLVRKGKVDEAIASYRTVIELDPNNAAAHAGLGSLLASRGNANESLASLQKAVELAPNNAQAHWRLAYALSGQNRLDEAIASYRKAIELGPKDNTAHNNLGVCLARQGKWDEAIPNYRKALELNPKNAIAHSNLGFALGNKGQWSEAVASYKQALALNPKFTNARNGLAHAQRMVVAQEKFAAFQKGEFKPTTNDERLGLADMCLSKKLYRAAGALYAEAFKSDPKLGDTLTTGRRYNAACCAALAAAGKGDDAANLDDKERARLRKQALDWLRADLVLRGKQIKSWLPGQASQARFALAHWQRDPDLADIRDAAALAKLPAEEQKAFTQLWADVRAAAAVPAPRVSGYSPLISNAAMQAWLGQDKELAATCEKALKEAKDTKDPMLAERTAKICSLRQSDAKTHEAALVLARRAVELGKGHGYMGHFQLALGMAEYRSGNYAAADTALLAASRLGKSNYYVTETAALYQAMSLFRQGKEAEARKLATEAVARMRPLPGDEKRPLAGGGNADDLILWLAYKEAKALIKFGAVPKPKAMRGG